MPLITGTGSSAMDTNAASENTHMYLFEEIARAQYYCNSDVLAIVLWLCNPVLHSLLFGCICAQYYCNSDVLAIVLWLCNHVLHSLLFGCICAQYYCNSDVLAIVLWLCNHVLCSLLFGCICAQYYCNSDVLAMSYGYVIVCCAVSCLDVSYLVCIMCMWYV